MSNGTPVGASDQELRELTANFLMSRAALINKYLDPRRDLDKECGYIPHKELTLQDYVTMWEENPVAARLVEIFPLESWKKQPSVYEEEDAEVETPFEAAWNAACRGLRGPSAFKDEEGNPLYQAMLRADILCGIGHYGVLLLGIDDGLELHEPVDTVMKAHEKGEMPTSGTVRRLLYVKALPENLAPITAFEIDPNNPRYGLPTKYLITLTDPTSLSGTGALGQPGISKEVHWTRVIHIADNVTSCEIAGTPRQFQCWKPLNDIRKVASGSGEMYWRGAFPGLSLETHPQLGGDVTLDGPELREQINSYMNSLQRYIATTGMTAKTLSPQVVDPTPQLKAQINLITIRIGCPERIFMGSERGELASSQDKDTWTERIEQRRDNFITPNILVPTVDRLIQMGVLPNPVEGYSVWWPNLSEMSAEVQSRVALARTQAAAAYISGGVHQLINESFFLTDFLGLDKNEAEELLEEMGESKLMEMEQEMNAQMRDESHQRALELKAATPAPIVKGAF